MQMQARIFRFLLVTARDLLLPGFIDLPLKIGQHFYHCFLATDPQEKLRLLREAGQLTNDQIEQLVDAWAAAWRPALSGGRLSQTQRELLRQLVCSLHEAGRPGAGPTPAEAVRRCLNRSVLAGGRQEVPPIVLRPEQEAVGRSLVQAALEGKTDYRGPRPLPPDAPRVPGYELLRVLGQGGFSVVYLARHVATGELRAVKVGLLADPRRFEREVRLLRNLSGPYVVRYHEHGELHGQFWIAMTYLGEYTLADLIATRLTTEQALLLAEQVLRGLAALHQSNVVHRDLKPENAMVDGELGLRLIDFGLAKPLPGSAVANTTSASTTLLGTPRYMSPEQVQGNETTFASDVWAFGCILSEMLTGKPLFESNNVMALGHEIMTKSLRWNRPEVPPEVMPFLDRCLQRGWARRWQSAKEALGPFAAVAAAVRRRLRQDAEAEQRQEEAGARRQQEGAAEERRRRRSASIVLCACLALGIGLATWRAYQAGAWGDDKKQPIAKHSELLTLASSPSDLRPPSTCARADRLAQSDLPIAKNDKASTPPSMPPAPKVEPPKPPQGPKLAKEIASQLREAEKKQHAWGIEYKVPSEYSQEDIEAAIPMLHDPDEAKKEGLPVGYLVEPSKRYGKRWVRMAPSGPELGPMVFIDNREGAARPAEPDRLRGHTGPVQSVAFSPDGTTLASASQDYTVKLWNVKDRQELATLKGHTNQVTSVAFSPDGKALASTSVDKTVRLWDVATREELATLDGHTSTVWCVAFSPDGKVLASASHDDTVKLWDARTGAERATLKGHTGAVLSVAFSPNGKRVASASADATVRIWDGATGKERVSLEGHSGGVSCVRYSPDGNTIASAGYDGTVKLWDAVNGEELTTLKGHRKVDFSPDSKVLAIASPDNSVKLWDVQDRKELATLKGHSHWVLAVAFSPDGKTLASAGQDKTIKLWDLTPPK
jgi:WD40 repeat protein/serine/threonine protein kinase